MKLSFHGSVRGVTGSCHLLKAKDVDGHERQLLFDCGMYQGEQMCGSKNKEEFGFDPMDINHLFITHPHADHTGRTPKLVKEGFRGKIYMTEPCVGLSKLVLEDAHHIMVEDSKKCGSSVLYELVDLMTAFDQVEGVGYHEEIEPFPGIKVMFHDAGHVLGSAFISVKAEGKTIIFSGDIGNDNVPILPDTEQIHSADYVVCESTYGHRVHEGKVERSERLKLAIEETIKNKSVLMIPAFSIERTQELLYEINLLLKNELKTNIQIYLDSPMAIKATELYREYKNYLRFDAPILEEKDRDFFSFPGLHETLDVQSSKQINYSPPPKIIIAGSGMMSGGRIMHHLIRYLGDPKNQLLIIGYQARGTTGRKIYEGAKKVKIFREEVHVNAKITAIGAFSAHGDMDKLTRWISPKDGKTPEKIFLVHGDPESKEVFATHLRHKLRTDVVIPGHHDVFEL
ncbi:MBL fold metallo-hydrolase [Candidatus Uhrbacteria bacterium]|jgi:metallo-beta-lactamase family protein|nr:MBL fold metallo-hydrolase [Candidatus Uhrbacteria bacterium]